MLDNVVDLRISKANRRCAGSPAVTVMMVLVELAFLCTVGPACAAGARWAPGAIPQVPAMLQKARDAHGVRMVISAPKNILAGDGVAVKITLVNHGTLWVGGRAFVPAWMWFPQAWCWGPDRIVAGRLTRYVAGGYQGASDVAGGAAIGASPGHRVSLRLPLNLSHMFDLSLPGKYEVQLAGKGLFFTAGPMHGGKMERHLAGTLLVSNVIRIRVLPPSDSPGGAAIRRTVAASPTKVEWGKPWHGVECASCVRTAPGMANPVARVRILFRCAGKHPATVSLTGNPHIDFRWRWLIGPFHTIIKAINGKPVPLTAYGSLLARRHRTVPPAVKVYTLKPGIIYTYWRPLVLNREFDLSVYGPYRFITRLHGTRLKTSPLINYVGVQPRFYRKVKPLK